MYICICNCIKDKHVESALADGVCTPGDVFRKMGCRPVCGKCVPEIADTIDYAKGVAVSK